MSEDLQTIEKQNESETRMEAPGVTVHALASARATQSIRFGRASSYCAETAWVWQRARFVCGRE